MAQIVFDLTNHFFFASEGNEILNVNVTVGKVSLIIAKKKSAGALNIETVERNTGMDTAKRNVYIFLS